MSDTQLETDVAGAARAAFAATVLGFEEVLEVFASYAASSLGRRALQQLVPRDDESARLALGRLAEMMELFAAEMQPSMAGLTDPFPHSADALRSLSEERLVGLRGLLQASVRLGEWFADHTDVAPLLAELTAELPDLSNLRERIDRVLDERGIVRNDASDLLARLRQNISRLSGEIDTSLRTLLRRSDIKNVLSDGSVHRRGGRPVFAVKSKSGGHVRGIVHDRSQSDASVFVEPQEVIEPGNRLAEARADERREVERVLLELSTDVRARAPEVRRMAGLLAEVELAYIGARYAREVDARPALLPEAGEGMVLRSARHPLLIEQVRRSLLDEVVPIDLRLGDDFDMLIVTGPNTGGKTLALKTAGLFALMTRAGLPLPCARGTRVPLYDCIAADIGDEQEISQNLSTFASHLVRIRGGLEVATGQSLVLLDELGGGTDPHEGAALGEAVLERLLERKAATIASTHIGKLKEFAFRHARAENACTEFDPETLAPCYRLLVGTPGESGALVIAKRLGLDESVVVRAHQRLERRDGEVEELMDDVRSARVDLERVRSEVDDRLDRATAEREAASAEREDLERRGELLEKEAQRSLEDRVRDALRQLEGAKSLLEQLPRDVQSRMRERLDALESDLSGATMSARRQAFLDGLSKGTLVYLPRYKQRVILKKVDRAGRTITALLGKMKIKVSFDEVTWYESL
jgi:DNA mismatch repair protein MutS2